jgi:hypothetical protein
LNLGSNRWNVDTQIGYTQFTQIGNRNFWLDAAADAIAYVVNRNAGPDHKPLTQKPTYQGQLWLSYAPTENRFSPLFSLGYAVQIGGVESINQIRNGLETESHQLRAAYSYFVTKSFQVVCQVSHDVHTVGGFQQSFGLTLRAFITY